MNFDKKISPIIAYIIIIVAVLSAITIMERLFVAVSGEVDAIMNII